MSQGGLYEVELGQLAEQQGAAQDIRDHDIRDQDILDQGNTEAHDHMPVAQALEAAADSAGVPLPSELNAEVKARLAEISAFKGERFDRAYVADMKEIHAGDGAAFLKEAKQGGDPALKSFAAATHDVVRRHSGEPDARTLELE
ncbi:DUF4142 domain-containing protein [Lichenibacterium minor]|uniref:DUF4142 domain-containing protein n=1 Tax=Lichenibacterium minor TaxID=2316528 RepID=A0A4V1RV66_9HYPH|nr:DUF4142 domain-containing protein [Lichenibacterium minor]